MKYIVTTRAFRISQSGSASLWRRSSFYFVASSKKKSLFYIPKLTTDFAAAISRLTFTPRRLSRPGLRCASLQLHSEPTKF